MKIADFKNHMSDQLAFSTQDIANTCGKIPHRQLHRWQVSGDIINIRRNFYCIRPARLDTYTAMTIANIIYSPSYVSGMSVLKMHNLIPEEIFSITSVTSRLPAHFSTDLGNFQYQKINSNLYWGYNLIKFKNNIILIAQLEKAILDFLYLHTYLKSEVDFESLRIDADEFNEQINLKKLQNYCHKFNNKTLQARLNIFIKTVSRC